MYAIFISVSTLVSLANDYQRYDVLSTTIPPASLHITVVLVLSMLVSLAAQ